MSLWQSLNPFARLSRWLRRPPEAIPPAAPRGVVRGPVDHVIVLDGTLASLNPGRDSNAGRAFQLLREAVPGAARRSLYYEPGLQWDHWRDTVAVLQGRGINRQIRRAYGHLASHYRPGDRIYLLGYSRGAYAVRSLAGVIDRVGLLRHDAATERNVTLAYRHYERSPDGAAARAFRRQNCHDQAPIEMVGVWDTVKALGLRLPLLWMLTEGRHAFHNHQLGSSVRHGFQALALHETREVFTPVFWHSPAGRTGGLEQVWFRGGHADIGGQLGDFVVARPLANIPLVWMLDRMAACGLMLPEGWRDRFPTDPKAPMLGTWRGFGAAFLLRRARVVGADASEFIHPTAAAMEPGRWHLPELILPEPEMSEPVLPEPVIQGSGRPEPVVFEAGMRESQMPDSAMPEPPMPKPARSEPARPEHVVPEAGMPQAASAERPPGHTPSERAVQDTGAEPAPAAGPRPRAGVLRCLVARPLRE